MRMLTAFEEYYVQSKDATKGAFKDELLITMKHFVCPKVKLLITNPKIKLPFNLLIICLMRMKMLIIPFAMVSQGKLPTINFSIMHCEKPCMKRILFSL